MPSETQDAEDIAEGAQSLANHALQTSLSLALANLLVEKGVFTRKELKHTVTKVAHMVIDAAAEDKAFSERLTDTAKRLVSEAEGVPIV